MRILHWSPGQTLMLLVVMLLSGCGSSSDSGASSTTMIPGTEPKRIQIVTTCGMVTDIVSRIAGPSAQVQGLMGEGVDPHLYKPTRNDIQAISQADIVFYSGLHLEGRMTESLEHLAAEGRKVFAVTDGIAREKLLRPEPNSETFDPHVWMDVSLWSESVAYVASKLSDCMPEHAIEFQERASSLTNELKKLDDYAKQSIASIPESQRVLVTAHDAFEYFSRAYNISVQSVQGISTESEAGVEDVNQLVRFLVDRKIKAIFVESSVSEKNIRAIMEGTAQQGWVVTIGGELFSDAMGAPGSYEGTYLGMLDHNITTITRALGGEAPLRGLNGKLSSSH